MNFGGVYCKGPNVAHAPFSQGKNVTPGARSFVGNFVHFMLNIKTHSDLLFFEIPWDSRKWVQIFRGVHIKDFVHFILNKNHSDFLISWGSRKWVQMFFLRGYT